VNAVAVIFRQVLQLHCVDTMTTLTKLYSMIFTGVIALMLDLQSIHCFVVAHNTKATFWF